MLIKGLRVFINTQFFLYTPCVSCEKKTMKGTIKTPYFVVIENVVLKGFKRRCSLTHISVFLMRYVSFMTPVHTNTQSCVLL